MKACQMNSREIKTPTFGLALLCMVSIIAFIALGMVKFGWSTPTVMFLCWVIVLPFGLYLGYTPAQLEKQALNLISRGLQAIMILLVVGAMIGCWIGSGTVATIIYAGIKLLSPNIFLLTALLFATLVACATGTSWGTMGTAGVALMGIGAAMGIPAGMTAGAVISGAYFGDKLSPMSDGPNLTCAITGAELIEHIKHSLKSALPGYLVSCVLFLILGFRYSGTQFDASGVTALAAGIEQSFRVGLIPLLPAVIVFILLAKKVSPILSILFGAFTGMLVCVFYQDLTFAQATTMFYAGFSKEFADPILATLFNRGGVSSMFATVSVGLFAMGFAGILNETGILGALVSPLEKHLKTQRSLVATTMAFGYINNCIGCSAGYSIIITGTLMKPLYEKFNLRNTNLSRVLGDCGTLFSVLVPWNTNALFAMSMLGVSFAEYVPFTFFCIITPIITLIYAFTGFSMTKENPVG